MHLFRYHTGLDHLDQVSSTHGSPAVVKTEKWHSVDEESTQSRDTGGQRNRKMRGQASRLICVQERGRGVAVELSKKQRELIEVVLWKMKWNQHSEIKQPS